MLEDAIRRAQQRLLRLQNHDDGYWCGELRADTTLESDAIMLWNALGRGSSAKVARLAAHLLSEQLPDGGWPIYRGGRSEVSATVKAYWALKLAGISPFTDSMVRARRRIFALGGVHRTNTYTKFYLALFGLYDWRGIPSIPPEMMLLPGWFPFHVGDMSAWTRAIVLPLSLLWSRKPRFECPAQGRLDELFLDGRRWVPLDQVKPHAPHRAWQSFFLWADGLLKKLDGRFPIARRHGEQAVETEIRRLMIGSDGLGAIYPGIVNTLLAFKALGYENEVTFEEQLRQFEALELDKGERLQMQPCVSPVWDTALALAALTGSDHEPSHPQLVASARWLLDKEIRKSGGWAFQHNNPHYPDVDDTAAVLLALRRVRLEGVLRLRRDEAVERGLRWILSMQCKEGGWAAFDRDNTMELLTEIPFADHNAMIDPPCEDITGRVLELLGRAGVPHTDPAVQRGVAFLRARQEEDGSWFGRWGVNYVYGTHLALRGLVWSGVPQDDPAIERAVEWLYSVQRPDGGWGESCRSYDEPSFKGVGLSTPAQTAWAVLALVAARRASDPRTRRGVDWLTRNQREDGGWDEAAFTGIGFPKVFYLEYTLYRDYFPLAALGAWRAARRTERAVERALALSGVEGPS